MSFLGRRLLLSYTTIGIPVGFIVGSDCYYHMTNQQKTSHDFSNLLINYPIGVMSIGISVISSLSWPIFVIKGIHDSRTNTENTKYKKSIDV